MASPTPSLSPEARHPSGKLYALGVISGALAGAAIPLGTTLSSHPGLSLVKALSESDPSLPPIMVIGGLVGFFSTRWCWLWAVENPHPLLTRLETWLPLRGKWLTYGMASLIFPLHWGVIMIMLILTCALPCSGILALPVVWMAIQLPLEPPKSTKR